MSYLKSTRPTFQASPSPSPCSVPAPMRLLVLYAEATVCFWGEGGGSSVRSDSHARYNDTVHDHRSQARPLKTQHSSSTDKTPLSCLPFDLAGYRTLNVPADAVFSNHTGFSDASHILLNLSFYAFPLPPWSESHKVVFFHKLTQQLCCIKGGLNIRVFVCRTVGGGRGQPHTLHGQTRCLCSLSILLLFLNTDLYLPTAQELSRFTSAMLTQARIKNSLFTPELRFYWSVFLCWETCCCFISPTSKP